MPQIHTTTATCDRGEAKAIGVHGNTLNRGAKRMNKGTYIP